MLYASFWVIPWRLKSIHRRFGTLCSIFYEDGIDSVPKRRHINLRHQGITQKKAYNKLWIVSKLCRPIPNLVKIR